MGTERSSKAPKVDAVGTVRAKRRPGREQLVGHELLWLQRSVGNQAVSRLLSAGDGIIRRSGIDYNFDIKRPLSYSYKDWMITERDCSWVVSAMNSPLVEDKELLDTYHKMQRQGLWDRLDENVADKDPGFKKLKSKLTRLGQPVETDKRLARLLATLQSGERVMKAVEMIVTKPASQKLAGDAAKKFGLAAGTLDKGMNVASAVTATDKLVKAINVLEGTDLRTDEGAKAIGSLLASAGELGKLLGKGPWTPYFDFLSRSGSFFIDMKKLMDPRNRAGGRYKKYMPN